MTKKMVMFLMALMLLGATTVSAASLECVGMNADIVMDMPCHTNIDDSSDMVSCDGCTCLHMVPYAELSELLLLEQAVEPHDILWRTVDRSNPSDELFQPPI